MRSDYLKLDYLEVKREIGHVKTIIGLTDRAAVGMSDFFASQKARLNSDLVILEQRLKELAPPEKAPPSKRQVKVNTGNA